MSESDADIALSNAARTGNAEALAAWADSLERRCHPGAAALVRRVPWVAAEVGRAVAEWRAVNGLGSVSFHTDHGDSWWFCGDSERGNTEEDGDELATAIGQLLQNWDTVHPAIEWLAHELRLPCVECALNPPTGNLLGIDLAFDLRARDRVEPLPAGHALTAAYFSERGMVEVDGE